jgi:uncharacterized membrane protein YphA (DoxX/SURF4 family)
MTEAIMNRLEAWRGHTPLALLARGLLAVVFIWAAWHKVLEPGEFALNVATYQILPLSLINLQAIGLPWVELLIGVLLISGLWTRESALITIGMNIMFIVAIIITLYRGEEILCGCFASGDAGHQIGWDLVIRDFGLLLVGVYLAWVGPRFAALDLVIAKRREEKQ